MKEDITSKVAYCAKCRTPTANYDGYCDLCSSDDELSDADKQAQWHDKFVENEQ